MRRDVFHFALAVNRQQPDLVILSLEVVNHSNAAAFTLSRHCPAELSHTTGAWYDPACFWILEQKALQAQILIIRQIFVDVLGKSSGFNEFHNPDYTAKPYN
jgi:hypothetical protein